MTHQLTQYTYLQLLDLLTTLAFLLRGIQEGNPVVRWALQLTSNPLLGLLAVKVFAVLLGVYCWRRGRERLLRRMNLLFAVVVAWNILALIAGSLPGIAL
jgi:hypothetical protein